MGRNPKLPNRQLAELLEETRISRKGLARRVVERGHSVGVELFYDHTSVGRWLAGEQPNTPVPELIAEVLTELIGRRLVPSDCGMSRGQESADLGLEFSLSLAEATAAATALWRSDVERRRFLTGASYAVAVYPAASMRWLTMREAEHPMSGSGGRLIGQSDVAAVRTMTAAFRDLDNRVGGGKVRSTIVHYLHSSVAPLLHGSYTEPVGRQLFAVTAELTKLAGWAAYDLEQHGLAQRYLIQALRMSRAAGDAGLGAEILAAMSHQATYVGRAGDAIDLARAAQITARTAGLPALESECHLVEAHGHAARADESSCAASLNAAEAAFGRADGARPPWLDYFDHAYMSAKIAHCFRDLGDLARTAQFAKQSLKMSEGYTRGRAFNLCLLASALVDGDPHEAVRLGTEALELVSGLRSQRTIAYLRDLCSRLSTHAALPDVAEFRQQVRTIARRAD